MRKFTKILLPVMCAVALMVSTFGSFGALSVSANASDANSILEKYDVESWNGFVQTGKKGDGVVTAWDILQEDGYIDGVWIPWLTHSYLGSSLAPNDLEAYDSYLGYDDEGVHGTQDYWQNMSLVGIEQYDNTQLEMEIFNLKALGYNMMAYAGSPWGEGRENDKNTWECTGVKEEYLKNIRTFLDICRRAQMPVVWYIHFHSSAVPEYASLDMWYKIDQVKANKEYADAYAEKFVKPVCKVLAEYRDVVVMCGIADETYNEINDSNFGDGTDNGENEDTKFEEGTREQFGVTMEDSMYFHSRIGQTVKEVMPDMPTTCADNADQYAMFGDAMLDMPGRNQYSSGTNPSCSVTEGWATGPLLAGEYGMGGSSGAYTEDVWSTTMVGKRQAYLDAGYSGFFQWAYEPNFKSAGASAPNGNQMHYQGAKTPYDLRTGAYQGYYWAVAKQGGSANAPSAMYYCGKTINMTSGTHEGNGKVYYIRPQNNATVTVERSTDGGNTWTTINNTPTYDSNAGNHRACVIDSSAPSSGTVQYRVSANGYTSYTNVWTY